MTKSASDPKLRFPLTWSMPKALAGWRDAASKAYSIEQPEIKYKYMAKLKTYADLVCSLNYKILSCFF